MDDIRFGVGEVVGTRRCSMYGCGKAAVLFVGDKKQQHAINNFFLCEEHAKVVYDEIKEKYFTEDDEFKPDNIEKVSGNSPLKDKYIELLYNNGGMVPKAKLVDFCKENGIEAPAEDMNTKKYMELIFPEILQTQEV